MTKHELSNGQLIVFVDCVGAQVTQIDYRGRTLLASVNAPPRGHNLGRESAWNDSYSGGWHLVTPNVAANDDDERFPFHGEAAWREWEILSLSETQIHLGLALETPPLYLTRRFSISGRSLQIDQEFVNESEESVFVEWAEHPAWGGVLLGETMTLHVDGRPQDLAAWSPDVPSGRFHSIRGLTGVYELANPEESTGVRVTYDSALLPWLVIWQEHRQPGPPWMGRVDAIGVEPSATDFAGSARSERTLLTIPATSTISGRVTALVLDM